MHEQFPTKKRGDSLSADHVNRLSSVASRFARTGNRTNQITKQSGSEFSNASLFPWTQHVVEVYSKYINDEDTESSGLYLVRLRWYSSIDEEWKTNTAKEYELDASELIGLEVGDKVVAYWDQQRSMFIPVDQEESQGRYFELKDALGPGETVAAYPREWDDDEGDYVTDTTADTFNVVDVLERFRGRGKNESEGIDGSKGIAVLRNGQWEIDHLQPHALLIVCRSEDNVQGEDISGFIVTVGSVKVVSPVKTALLMIEPLTTVTNPHFWDIPEDGRIVAMWNDETENYEILQVDC